MADRASPKFKIVVRVDLIPDGDTVPQLIQDGREPLAYVTLDATANEQGALFTGTDVLTPPAPVQIFKLAQCGMEIATRAMADFVEGCDPVTGQPMLGEVRQYDENGNDITGTPRTKYQLN
ncbi:hypothetical protein [Atlantibacter hermannii]